jgi:L-iditol 2-dehydrogenase
MCRQFKETNIEPGGFTEFLRASALHVRHTVLKIPKKLGSLEASQTEPLACCLRNVKRLNVREGDVIAIIGLGAIGLMTAQLLKSRGAAVLGLDLDASRAKALAPFGKGFTDAAAMEEAVFSASAGRGADALVLTAGPASNAADRMTWIREGGALNIFASFHPSQAALDLNLIYHRELAVISSYSPALEDLEESLELIASGTFSVSALNPKVYPLEKFAAAESDVRSRKTMKAILAPR